MSVSKLNLLRPPQARPFFRSESREAKGVLYRLFFFKHHRKALDYFTALPAAQFFLNLCKAGNHIAVAHRHSARPPRKLAKPRWQNDFAHSGVCRFDCKDADPQNSDFQARVYDSLRFRMSIHDRDFEIAKALRTLQDNTDPENLIAATKQNISKAVAKYDLHILGALAITQVWNSQLGNPSVSFRPLTLVHRRSATSQSLRIYTLSKPVRLWLDTPLHPSLPLGICATAPVFVSVSLRSSAGSSIARSKAPTR
jgi:hypothetical protein